MKNLLIACLLILSSLSVSYSQDNAGYREALKKMFEVSGSEEVYKSVIRQMFVLLKQRPDVPAEVWDGLEQEFMKTSMDDLVTMLIPVYEKHLTQGDLEMMIEFYQTPVGSKFAQKSPMIMQESMQIGQQWGLKIGQDFERKLKERGY